MTTEGTELYMLEKSGKIDHTGHRARMRDRFFQTELKGFQPYETLEMLLYFTVPRADTVPLARRLLEQFGSVRGVLNAAPDELMQVRGVSERTAFLFSFLHKLYLRMLNEEKTGILLDDYAKVKDYVRQLYAFDGDREVLRCILLDKKLAVKSVQILSTGEPDAVHLAVKDIKKLAEAAKSAALILVHSHPGKPAAPSNADISGTRVLARKLREAGISLSDHIIIGADGIISLREYGTFLALEE